MTLMKYNPGFLTDDQLVDSFCVRTHEFESAIEMLRECDGNSNAHRLIIGPRGCGKTTLLLRIAVELRRDSQLSDLFFPITFAEESYGVASSDEFWLEALACLADQAPHQKGDDDLRLTYEELKKVRDDRSLGKRCLSALLDFADRRAKRLVLIVENLDMMFRDMADPDAGWKLRQTLQTEARIVLLAGATTRFDEIDDPDRAFYDLFTTRILQPLEVEECSVLWESVSGQPRSPEAMRGLRILTGGSPRLLSIVACFGAEMSFRNLMADLLHLIDDLTAYFKNHIEALPSQERRVYLTLAEVWEPATAREIAELARLETTTCSAQLKRLVGRGVVDVVGGHPRRKLYYLAERLYNIYYLLRHSRKTNPLVQALIRFMEAYYSPPELKSLGSRMVQEVNGLESEAKDLQWAAFSELVKLPTLAPFRKELLSDVPAGLVKDLEPVAGERAGQTGGETRFGELARNQPRQIDGSPSVEEAESLFQEGKFADAANACEEIIRRFGTSSSPAMQVVVARSLITKGMANGKLHGVEAELSAYDEVVENFADSLALEVQLQVAAALHRKGEILAGDERFEEAGAVCDEIVRLFGDHKALEVQEPVAIALINKGMTLNRLDLHDEAIHVSEEIIRRFGHIAAPVFRVVVAQAFNGKALMLEASNRQEEAVGVCDQAVSRFGGATEPKVRLQAAYALEHKGTLLLSLDQPKEAIEVCELLVRKFESLKERDLDIVVAQTFITKALALDSLGLPEEAIDTCREAVHRFNDSEESGVLDTLVGVQLYQAGTLARLSRYDEAIDACDQICGRTEESVETKNQIGLAYALVIKADALAKLDRTGEAITACHTVIRRFTSSEIPEVQSQVVTALLLLAEGEKRRGSFQKAVRTLDSIFGRLGPEDVRRQCHVHLILAQTHLAAGDAKRAERDTARALLLLPGCDELLAQSVDVLVEFAVLYGEELVHSIITDSPSNEILLPLSVALDKEMGGKPKVALEVKEVAEDIRRDIHRRKGDVPIDHLEKQGI